MHNLSFRLGLALIALSALALRSLFYNGIVGSDDITYFDRALDVASGAWTSANYNGALRYGFNIPVGLVLAIGGPSTVLANLWPLACSVVEVVLVGLVARDLGGRLAGWAAAALLATTPLHIAAATRIHTDPIVSCFLTAAFVALWAGLRRRDDRLLVLAGLCFGGVFWSKELAAVTYFGALPMLWYFRRRPGGVVWVLAGLAVSLATNFALMWVIAGDPLHAVKVVLGALGRNFVRGGQSEDAALYYVPYLFVDIRHIGLLGWLTAFGIGAILLGRQRDRPSGRNTSASPSENDVPGAEFFVLWLGGLLLVLSVFPVSLQPLRWTMKQSNYITLFLAPLAVLAAIAIVRLPVRLAAAVTITSLSVGVVLGALQQADLRAFVGNGKALWSYLVANPGTIAVASNSNDRIVAMLATERPHIKAPTVLISASTELADGRVPRPRPGIGRLVVVIDPQTTTWFNRGFDHPLPCWREEVKLMPANLGLGNRLAGALLIMAHGLPGRLGTVAQGRLEPLAMPRPALVYAVPGFDLWCSATQTR